MGLVCPELSLDLKPSNSSNSYVPETINGFLQQVSMIGDSSQKLDKLNHFVKSLEDEMNKIQVFQRELPLCMLLLNDAISFLKQETTQYKTINGADQPVIEEFIPLKKDSNSKTETDEGEEDCGKDKKNWMSSVQLWNSDDVTPPHMSCQTLVKEQKMNKRNQMMDNDSCIVRAGTGSKGGVVSLIHNNFSKMDKEDTNTSVPGLTLMVPGMMKQHSQEDSAVGITRFNPKLGASATGIVSSSSSATSGRPSHQQPSASARKQRRCWSPELHRRFVDALTQLGGPQVATPKQIRELMRVDGLTNDEVKSHLQKYRLHTRRVSSDSGTCTNKKGGSWAAHQDLYSDTSKPSRSASASPEGPHQFPGLTGSMEDEDENEEDEKSESYSWKGNVHRPGKDDV
ncbi:Transcription factor HHO5 [Bienertia sinuspersici]